MWVIGSRGWQCVLVSALLANVTVYSPVRAQAQQAPAAEGTSKKRRLLPPPVPSEIPPRLGVEVHINAAGPVSNDSLCPEGASCVFGGGGGIGATVERRQPSGLGWFGGYDAWFLDSASVFELGVQQSIRLGVRFTMPNEVLVHPVMEFAIGAMGLGDTFRLSTVGALAQAMVGAELELNEHYSLVVGFLLRAFTATAFQSDRDEVRRANTGLISQAMAFQFGLSVL